MAGDEVGRTAYGAGMMRALEGHARRPLFDDPVAERFLSGWAAVVTRQPLLRHAFLRALDRVGPGFFGAVACRTRVIDDACRQALADWAGGPDGIEQAHQTSGQSRTDETQHAHRTSWQSGASEPSGASGTDGASGIGETSGTDGAGGTDEASDIGEASGIGGATGTGGASGTDEASGTDGAGGTRGASKKSGPGGTDRAEEDDEPDGADTQEGSGQGSGGQGLNGQKTSTQGRDARRTGEHKAARVVIVGAGMDTRPYRMAEMRAAEVWELDLPEVQERKKAAVVRVFGALPAHVRYVPVDLTRQRIADVVGAGGRRTLVLCEAVGMYLPEAAVEGIIAYAATVGPGGRFVVTYVPRGVLADPRYARWARRLGWRTAFEPAEVARALERHGFRVLADRGAAEYQEQLLRPLGRRLRVFEGERVAVADLPS